MSRRIANIILRDDIAIEVHDLYALTFMCQINSDHFIQIIDTIICFKVTQINRNKIIIIYKF